MVYSKKFINFVVLIIIIIVFIIFNLFFFKKPKQTLNNDNILNVQENQIKEDKEDKEDEEIIIEEENNLGEWYIEIPSINLKAPIEEGTSLEILNKKIGHFEETSFKEGNIGLAGHNRGYEKNYFQNLKNVKINDKIFYKYKEFEKTYIIDTIEIILNSDWSYLKNSEENRITLITCVENEPQYRRCVQGVELDEI